MTGTGDQHSDVSPPGLFDERTAITAADARAAADLAAGRVIGHAAVLHWLTCWGHDTPLLPVPWPE